MTKTLVKKKSGRGDPVAEAVTKIDALIGLGQLAPGQRLVEIDLAERLGIGRTRIREALRILAGDGVVELLHNRGARVRLYNHHQLLEMLRAVVALICAGMEEFVVSPDYERGMRELEAVTRNISARIQDFDLDGLLEAMERYQYTIFEASGNGYLVELHRRIHVHHYRQIFSALGSAQLLRITTVYARITQELRRKNAVRGSALLKAGLAQTAKVLAQPTARGRALAIDAPQPARRSSS